MLTHKGTQTIETERLILRKARIEDTEPMFRNWANDAEVTKYLTWPPHENIEVTKNLLAGWAENHPWSKTEFHYVHFVRLCPESEVFKLTCQICP